MKTEKDFLQDFNELTMAHMALITDPDKEVGDNRLQKINEMEKKLNNFHQYSLLEEKQELFTLYLEAQGKLYEFTKELRTAISQFNDRNPSQQKKLTEFLPLYYLQYSALDKKSYDEFFKNLTNEYNMLLPKRFKFTSQPENLIIKIVGYLPDARKIIDTILMDDFSKYCKYEIMSVNRSAPSLLFKNNVTPTTSVSTTPESKFNSNSRSNPS